MPQLYAEYRKAYWQKNRERKNATLKAWREKNRDHVNTLVRSNYEKKREYYKAYKNTWRAKRDPEKKRAENKRWAEAGRERVKAWVKANRKKIAEQTKARYNANPEKRAAYSKKWREANHEVVLKRERLYDKKRQAKRIAERRTDLALRLIDRHRTRIHCALKKQNRQKKARSIKLLGCDVYWLIAWLEVQFQDGMTWQNYGPIWHIDHIRPCASFDLSDLAQQRLCFHWTNLQPLFARENISKGARYKEQK